jgi:hypothetical protein
MVNEFLDAVFNFDSRFFQTIGTLFVPGKLTTEYFKGRHRRYVHPLRIFLVMTLALMAVITFNMDDDEKDMFNFQENLEESKINLAKREVFLQIDTVSIELAEEFPTAKTLAMLDSLKARLMVKIDLEDTDSSNLEAISLGFSDLKKISNKDLFNLDIPEILEKYQVKGFLATIEVSQKIRLMKNGGNFAVYLIQNVSWMIFVIMPFLALILKLFYVRRQYYYVEHLIFSFHSHAFVFLIFIILMILPESIPESTEGLLFLTIPVYLYFAMKRVYSQRIFKTLMKFILLIFSYLIILIIAIVATFLISFAIF